MRTCLVLALVACGGPSPPATPLGAPASLTSAPRGSGDVIVAQVDGRPVWGSCVAAQASARGLARDAALRECIDFELLAQAAERRGLAADREVVLATRTALVSQLVATVFEDGFQQPSDFGDFWDKATTTASKKSLIWSVQHDEYRASTYARAPLAKNPSPQDEAAAHALADKIAAAAATETGMFPADFVTIATRVAAGAKLEHVDVEPFRAGSLDDNYAAALFAIPEIGRSSAAVRTAWGWDVILYTGDVPASKPSPDELTKLLLPHVKQAYFQVWVSKIERSLGVHLEVEKDAMARLEKLE